MKHKRSEKLFARAKAVIPGGVNSPVRAFKSVGLTPPFIAKAKGPHLWDVDGNKYIDFVGSWGPMLLGHSHPNIQRAINNTVKNGTSFGAPTEMEVIMAELITELVPSMEMVRMVNSGTEATMSAIRVARAFSGRDKIIKFEGCYHGHGDSFLIKAGSGVATLGIPDSPGVPKHLAKETLTASFNDLSSVQTLIDAHPGEIGALIVEPVVGNMGCVPPQPGFLEGLRAICTKHKIVFIMDEVMTGFRVSRGGAQELYNITPDMTTLGKIIGGGLPVGAYGGKREIMEMVAPSGPVYQAGTLSGNPLAMAAGYAMLTGLKKDKTLYKRLNKSAQKLQSGMESSLSEFGLPFTINRVGSMFTLFFTATPVIDWATAKTSDTALFGNYFRLMLDQGIYLAPSQFEAAFLSASHSDRDLDRTLAAGRKAFKQLSKG